MRGHRGLSDEQIWQSKLRERAAIVPACEQHLEHLQRHAHFPVEQQIRSRSYGAFPIWRDRL